MLCKLLLLLLYNDILMQDVKLWKNHRVLYQKETWETIESNLHISEAHKNDIIDLESHHNVVTGLSLEQISIPLSRQPLLPYCYPPMRKSMWNQVLNLECHAGQTCPGVPMLYALLVLQWGKTMEVRGESKFLVPHLIPREQSWATRSPWCIFRLSLCTPEEWAALERPPLWLISHHKNIFKAMVQAALLTIKRKDHIIAVINHWLRFIIAIIPSKFIVTAVNDQFIRALTILGNGLSRLMRVTTNFSRIIA